MLAVCDETRGYMDSLFGRVDWATKLEIEGVQYGKLARLLQSVYDTNPFYRRLFDDRGLRPDHITSLAEYRRLVPVTRKEDLVHNQEESLWGDRLGIDEADIRQVSMTGGTSGRGQEMHALSQRDVEATALGHAWFCYMAGVRPGMRILNTFPVALSAGGQWLHRSLSILGAVPLMVAMYDTRKRLTELIRFAPDAVMGSTSYLIAMATQAQEEGINLAGGSVRILLTAGEPYTVDRIELIERLWGAKVFVWYGSTQRVMAGSCEHGALHGNQRGVLHVPESLIYSEVVDPNTGDIVEFGQPGEMVHTFLHSQASPLLRYASADRVVRLGPETCDCGRTFEGIEGGTISRYDDMIKIKGVNIWPAVMDELIFREPVVREYQGRVSLDRGREQVNVYIEAHKGATADVLREAFGRMKQSTRDALGLNFEFVRAASTLPRFDDDQHKPKRWKDERLA
jgi:phenylacetate-CoA ligase